MARAHKPAGRAQVDELRTGLLLLGADVETIAAEIERLYGYRPRAAWRLAHGWDQAEAAQRYNALVQSRGPDHARQDTCTITRVSEYERWPAAPRRPSVYVLATFAELYGTSVRRLLDGEDLAALPAPDRAALLGAAVRPADAAAAPARPARRTVGDGPGCSLEELVSRAADESVQAALEAGASNVGTATIDLLQAQIAATVADAEHAPAAQTLTRVIAVRDAALQLLAGRQRPGQTRDLNGIAAAACALLGWVCGDLGQHFAATSQTAAAWTFAELAEQAPVAAAVRTAQAKVSYWAGDVAGSARYAQAGLDELTTAPDGTVGVLLASMLARATARLGDVDAAGAALTAVEAQRDLAGDPAAGGLISCSVVGQHCFVAGALLTLGDPDGALVQADAAEQAWRVGDPLAYRSISMARVTAVAAHLSLGDLDAAGARMAQLSALPAGQRVATFGQRLGRAETLLVCARLAADPRAVALREEIVDFRRGEPRALAGR